MKWFTGVRAFLAVALVIVLAAPVALCAVNAQSTRHSCCEGGKTDHQPVKPPSCCSVQAPTQPIVTSGFTVQQVVLPTVAVVTSSPAVVQVDPAMTVSLIEFSPPHCSTVLRI